VWQRCGRVPLGLAMLVLLAGSATGAGLREPICHGSRAMSAIALTFDACQAGKPAGYDAAVIRVLRCAHTPATLFLGGRWMESHAAVTKELSRDPLFELANHSYSHPHMLGLAEPRIREELQKTQDVMFRLTGARGSLFRPPYGEYDARLLAVADRLGLRTIKWEVVSGDPDRHITAAKMVRAVAGRTGNGSIIIMHMNGRGHHTAEALPRIIRELRGRGYRFVTVSELLRLAPA